MNKKALHNLSITDFARYLETHGWCIDFEHPYSVIWRKFKGNQFLGEITLPKEETVDKEESLTRALQRLAEYENISPNLMLSKIMNQHNDLISIRVVGKSVQDGTIPLNDGVKLFEKTKNLIHALALSAKKKKSLFSNGSGGKDVLSFMDQIRLGQTQVGSYIINLCYPVENIEVGKQNEIIEAISFSRSVTHNLLNSLNKLKEKAQNYDQDPTVFASLIPEGVSHNLCDAIVGLSGIQKQRTVEISLQAGPIKDDSITTSDFKISFTPAEIAVVETASKYYQGEYTLPYYEVIGKIVGLHSRNLSEGGYIQVPCKVDNKTVEIRIDLTPEQYQTATEAHKTEKQVICKGQDLYINKKKGRLQKTTLLTIL
ncbi:hypothetical protein A4G19_13860 [Pasteurellaceae bacterium Macca]|nr:hypothetical protein [Pasteurellaceae bacterium Macca]MCK3656764.1 hypothetical protein [Pasteurellaceae bacterium Macca]